jgi:predicted Rossmann-fold nucleotide-binding protein
MGTMDELFEMLTWNNLNIHQKKVIVLNWEGYYAPLIAMMEHMHNEGFMYDDWRNRITVAKDAKAVMQTIQAWSGE